MYRLFVKIKNIPILLTANQLLVNFVDIIRALYVLLIRFVLPTNSLIDRSFQICLSCQLNYTLNYFF